MKRTTKLTTKQMASRIKELKKEVERLRKRVFKLEDTYEQ